MIEQSGGEKRGAAFCPNGNGVIKKNGGKIGTDVGRRNEMREQLAGKCLIQRCMTQI